MFIFRSLLPLAALLPLLERCEPLHRPPVATISRDAATLARPRPADTDRVADDDATPPVSAALDMTESPPEEVPTTYGTLAASLAAAPWPCQYSGRRVPQAYGSEWYGEADNQPPPAVAKLPASLRDALVACRVETSGCYDQPVFGGCKPDLELSLQPPSGPRVVVFSGPSRDSGRISIPLVQLQRGETLTLSAQDLDFFGRDPIGTLRLRYQGEPILRARSSALRATCRISPKEEIEPWLHSGLAKLDTELRQLRLKIDPEDSTLGLILTGLTDRRQEACELAAVVGWVEPRLRNRVAELERRGDAWEDAVRKLLDTHAVPVGLTATLPAGWKSAERADEMHLAAPRHPHRRDALRPDPGRQHGCAAAVDRRPLPEQRPGWPQAELFHARRHAPRSHFSRVFLRRCTQKISAQ